jgi:AsmA protein
MAIGRVVRFTLKTLVVLVVLVVVLVATLVVLLNTGAVTNRVKDMIVPRVSLALGRQVTLEEAKLRLFPGPRVALLGAALAGRPGEPPLAQLESVEVTLDIWPLIRSFGKDIRVDGVRLIKPVVNLVRAKDGTWNYEGIGKAGPAEQKPKTAPATPGTAPPAVVVAQLAIEDGMVQLIDHETGGQAAVAISQIRFESENVGLGRPFDASLSAAIVGNEKNFEMKVKTSPINMDLGPGRYPEVNGTIALTGLDLARLRAFVPSSVKQVVSGGWLEAHFAITPQSEKYRIQGNGKLSKLRLRGEPAEGGFALTVVVNPITSALQATIEKLTLKGPGVDLGMNATVHTKPIRARFVIAGPLLDLGQVMGLLPEESAPKAAPPPKKASAKGGAPLTAEQRRAVEALDVAGTLDIAKVVKGGLVATGFRAKVVLEKGVFVLSEAHAGFFDGKVNAGGTRADLAAAEPKWELSAKLDNIDMEKALDAFAGKAPLVGRMTGKVELKGTGVEWDGLKRVLVGDGNIGLRQGALTTTDLGGKVLGGVAEALRAAGKSAASQKVGGASGKTDIRDLAIQFVVKDGFMILTKPITFGTSFGGANLTGKIGLDGSVHLDGTATVSKETMADLLSGTGLSAMALEVPVGIGGSLEGPTVRVDAQAAVGGLVKGAIKQEVKKIEKKIEKKVGDRIKKETGKGVGGLLKGLGGKKR